jgi:hypothetical protein
MRLPLVTFALGSLLVAACGCGPSPTGGGGPGGSPGWTVKSENAGELPNGATTYGTYDGKRGDRVRATVSAGPEPVDVRLEVVDLQGKEKVLAEKKQVKDATLEGEVPYDGTVRLAVRLTAGKNTSYRYKIERR